MTTDQTARIDETVIEALRARPRRYDVNVDDELVISVLPNGVKTWTWVYDEASPHRKTLGVYPDMSLNDAMKSLTFEKESRRRSRSSDPEFVIRDGRIESRAPSRRLPLIIGFIVAVLAIGVIGYLFASLTSDTSGDSTADTRAAPGKTQPAQTAQQTGPKKQRPDISSSQTVATVVNSTDPAATVTNDGDAIAPPLNPHAAPTSQLMEDVAEGGETTVAPIAVANEPAMQTMTVDVDPATQGAPSLSAPDSQASAAALNEATDLAAAPDDITEIAAVSVEAGVTPSSLTSDKASELAMNAGLQTGATQIATPEPSRDSGATVIPDQNTTLVGMLLDDSETGLVLDSRVARGQLTSAVLRREPVDDLDATIVGNGEDLQTYFFFTELRQLAGQRVRHRWIHRNRVVGEVPFDVGEAWRWRVYSSKDFLATTSGDWVVQVVLDDETVIYSLPFTFIP